MPLELLLPPVTEARVDAATTAPTDIQGNMQSVAARVFARGVSAFLGVNMPTVPAGETLYPILSAGHTPAMTAAGTAHRCDGSDVCHCHCRAKATHWPLLGAH